MERQSWEHTGSNMEGDNQHLVTPNPHRGTIKCRPGLALCPMLNAAQRKQKQRESAPMPAP